MTEPPDFRALSPTLLGELLYSTPVGLGLLDTSLRFQYVNATLAKINGLEPAAHVGRTIAAVLPKLAPALEPTLRRVLATGEPALHVALSGETEAAPGLQRSWRASYLPLYAPGGELHAISILVVEDTERKRGEDRLQFLVQASTLLSASLDYETTFRSITALAVPHLADWCIVALREPDDSVRQVAVAHVEPEKAELAREAWRISPIDINAPYGVGKALRSGQSDWAPRVPDEVLVASFRDPDLLRVIRALGLQSYMDVPMIVRGQAIGTISFVSTGRFYDEQDLALAEDLARRAAVAIDNARLYQEAQLAIRVREEFLSVASHELRTPLTVIKGQIQYLLRQLTRPTPAPLTLSALGPERLLRHLHQADAAITRLTTLVLDLLDTGRLLQNRPITIQPEPMELAPLLARTVESAQLLRGQRSYASTLRFELALPDETIWGEWDPSRLEQALLNLLENAMKYSPDGGAIRVALALEPGAQPGQPGPLAHVTVRDQGLGIAPEQQQHIFEPFFRGANASGRELPGLGIGLAITRDIVERHAGQIWVESKGAGQGCTFHLVLPVRGAPA